MRRLGTSFALVLLGLAGIQQEARGAASLTRTPDPNAIYGGTEVSTCGWPTTVAMGTSCTGTLVHPRVVIYAAHCGTKFDDIRLGETSEGGPGRTVATDFCKKYKGGNVGKGTDFAICVLATPVDDLAIVPPLMGCETEILQPGEDAVLVGFGDADNGTSGIKRAVTAEIQENIANNEVFVGGGGKDACFGDSGGPAFVQLPADQYGQASWRVFGVTSYGVGECGTGTFYSLIHGNMAWFEDASGFDLTPCHDADGTWSPGPECTQVPLDPATGAGNWGDGCESGPLGGYESSCGEPHLLVDDVAPVVSFVQPADDARFVVDEDGDEATIAFEITAEDNNGSGVEQVQILADGNPIPGDGLDAPPYSVELRLSVGAHELEAQATDREGNQGTATITIHVDQDAGGTASATRSADSDIGMDPSSGGTSSAGAMPQVGAGDGCSCRSASVDRSWWVLLGFFGLLGWPRRG
jgi:MYXO-CTERM domain-containing protein